MDLPTIAPNQPAVPDARALGAGVNPVTDIATSASAALYMTVPDACARSGLGRTSIYEALKNGRVRARKAGQRTLIEAASLTEWLDSLPIWTPIAGGGPDR